MHACTARCVAYVVLGTATFPLYLPSRPNRLDGASFFHFHFISVDDHIHLVEGIPIMPWTLEHSAVRPFSLSLSLFFADFLSSSTIPKYHAGYRFFCCYYIDWIGIIIFFVAVDVTVHHYSLCMHSLALSKAMNDIQTKLEGEKANGNCSNLWLCWQQMNLLCSQCSTYSTHYIHRTATRDPHPVQWEQASTLLSNLFGHRNDLCHIRFNFERSLRVRAPALIRLGPAFFHTTGSRFKAILPLRSEATLYTAYDYGAESLATCASFAWAEHIIHIICPGAKKRNNHGYGGPMEMSDGRCVAYGNEDNHG